MTNSIDKIFKNHSFNSRLLLKEMEGREIELFPLKGTHLVSAKYNNHLENFYDIYSNFLPYVKGLLIDDKFYSKNFLDLNSFPINKGQVFDNFNINLALDYAKKIGFPVVFKPTMSSHGDNVVMDIENENELKIIINRFSSVYKGKIFFLIEEQFDGNEYRLFVTKNGFFATVWRIPANVKGDGIKSIRELIISENYRRMHPRNTCLCKIPRDQISKKYLKKQGLSLDTVPRKNQVIFLRKNSNVSTGGNCFDITNKVNLKFKKVAFKILEIFNAPFIGVDLLTKDITKPGNFVICELNSSPGLSLHMMPERGEKRDVAAAIIDVIFPETKK